MKQLLIAAALITATSATFAQPAEQPLCDYERKTDCRRLCFYDQDTDCWVDLNEKARNVMFEKMLACNNSPNYAICLRNIGWREPLW